MYEAIENAKEFLGLALLMFETANEALPNPTPLSDVRIKSYEMAVRLKVILIDARIKEEYDLTTFDYETERVFFRTGKKRQSPVYFII